MICKEQDPIELITFTTNDRAFNPSTREDTVYVSSVQSTHNSTVSYLTPSFQTRRSSALSPQELDRRNRFLNVLRNKTGEESTTDNTNPMDIEMQELTRHS